MSQEGKSIIEDGMILTAEISGKGELVVRGCLEGNIHLPEDTLTVEESGFVEGTIKVQTAHIAGEMRGQLIASGIVHIGSAGVVDGTIKAARMDIQDGASVTGPLDIGTTEKRRDGSGIPASS
jgi:cytoskeletal protein CcmA (bactofilin family)